MDDTYGWSFGELVCVCCGASIGCVEYVVWDVVFDDFFSLSFSFLFYGNSEFFSVWLLAFFCKIQKVVFFWGKTRDSENTVLNIFFGFGVAAIWLIIGRCQAVKGKKGPRWMLLFFFSFFLSRQRHFRKDKTHKTHILQHIHLSYTTQNQHFFPFFFSWNWCGEQVFIYFFISRFFFWPFFWPSSIGGNG